MLIQNITKKRQINELFLEPKPEFDIGNNKKYKVKAIKDSVVYIKKTKKIYQAYIIWFFGKDTQKKKASKNPPLQSYIFGK